MSRLDHSSTDMISAASPSADSLEQFGMGLGGDSSSAAATPLSSVVDDCADTTAVDSGSSSHAPPLGHLNSRHSASPSPSPASGCFDQLNSSSSNTPTNLAGRFRRHSSQSASLSNIPLNLSLSSSYAGPGPSSGLMSPLTVTSNVPNGNSDRICSSPINSLKMSSRVCQIKIDEGIEPHLSREIKSERETQNTLKLKSSCDELMINNDELESLTFDRQLVDSSQPPNGRPTNSPNFLLNASLSSNPAFAGLNGATFRRYRTFSESYNQTVNNINGAGNVPSPSTLSCSYSNSSSPTGGVGASCSHSGLLRCFSPSGIPSSASQNGHQQSPSPAPPPTAPSPGLSNNYFSQSPSPTRKQFVTRRSMSPVTCTLRPSSLGVVGVNSAGNGVNCPSPNVGSNKRKFSDIDQNDLSNSTLLSIHSHSPKRSNLETQQEFVQPLLIFTGNSSSTNNHTKTRSATSSPSPSPLSVASSSSSPPPITPSLLLPPPPPPPPPPLPPRSLIIPSNDRGHIESMSIEAGAASLDQDDVNAEINIDGDDSDSVSSSSPSLQRRRPYLASSAASRYTFVPIQLPSSQQSNFFVQNKRINSLTSGVISNASIAQLSLANNCNSNSSASPNNSTPTSAAYSCDSPLTSYSPTLIASVSSTVDGDDKPNREVT